MPESRENLDLLHRVQRLHGRAHGAVRWFAGVLDMSDDHVSKLLRARVAVPAWVPLLIALLEIVPRDRWPDEIKPDAGRSDRSNLSRS